MSLKLFIIALLCASAFADGAWVSAFYKNGTGSVDFFIRLHQKYPDFVIILYEEPNSFNQSYQNAVTAGYTSIHLSFWLPDSFQPENIPAGFSGRIWIEAPWWIYTTAELVGKIEAIANQGFNVGILTTLYSTKDGTLSSIVSSLPLVWSSQRQPWKPMAGWSCPSQTLVSAGLDPADMQIWSSTVNIDCI